MRPRIENVSRVSRIAGMGLLALTMALTSGCGGKSSTTQPNNNGGGSDSPIVTAQMAGLWSSTLTLRDCSTHAVIHTSTSTDTLCTGQNLGDMAGQAGGGSNPCTITKNGSAFHIVCDETELIQTGCEMKIHTDMSLTYTNTTYTATGQVNITTSPEGCSAEVPDQCMTLEVTGTRTGPAPAGACQ